MTDDLAKNKHFGKSSLNKEDSQFRIYLINPDGINMKDDFAQMGLISHHAAGAEIDCLLLPESNVAFRNPIPRSKVEEHISKVWEHKKFTWAASKQKITKWKQPGGCCSIIAGNWSSQVSKSHQDPKGLGRWTTQILNGK